MVKRLENHVRTYTHTHENAPTTTSHVQNVFCLAHQIITSNTGLFPFGMFITIVNANVRVREHTHRETFSSSIKAAAIATPKLKMNGLYIDARLITERFFFC